MQTGSRKKQSAIHQLIITLEAHTDSVDKRGTVDEKNKIIMHLCVPH